MEVLTEKQERVLWLALKLGFFDYPRKIDSIEFSRKLGIVPSTLSEITRRGMLRLLKHYFSGAVAAERKNKLEINPTSFGGAWEAESLRSVYSAIRFFKAAVQDDMYIEKEQFYLKRQPLVRG